MERFPRILLAAIVLLGTAAFCQPCPKVKYTTTPATVKSLVTTVNCLVAQNKPTAGEMNQTSAPEPTASGLSVDAFRIVGPQHTRRYRKVVLALLVIPAGDRTNSGVVTPDLRQTSVAATGGASCTAKLNPDNTVDAQCNLTGGTLYVIYHN